MIAAIWGLVGTIVGALASMTTTWLTTRNSYFLQQEKTREERAQHARAFQQQTLLDLQEAIHEVLRLITRAYIEDSKAQADAMQWGTGMLPEEVNEGIRLAQRRVALLVERVADDDVRLRVKALMSRVPQVLFSSSEQQARSHLDESTKEANRVLEGIGTVLRQLYDPTLFLPRLR